MKKTDAILIIEQCLVEPHFPDDSQKQAAVILKKLEKAGMLPPSRKRNREEYPELSDSQYKRFYDDSLVNKWEDG